MGLYPPRVSSNPPVLTRRYDTVEFFVDGSNGSDDGSRPGDRPEKPLLTIKEAISRCNSGEQNIINMIAPGHVTETNPIVIDKQFVTIRGWPSQGGLDCDSPMTCVATVDAAYFTIAAQDVVIRDMVIHGGASHPTINFSPVAWSFRTGIHNVTFKAGTWGIAQGALDASGFVADAPSHDWFITNCKFKPTLSSGGIFLASNGSWGVIADNYFESAPLGVYAHLNCLSAAVQVLRNRFMCPAEAGGEAIDIAGAALTRWIVADNMANDASNTASANSPYADANDACAWFRNVESGTGFAETAPT